VNGRIISRLLGNLLFALGLTMGLCLPVAYYYSEPQAGFALAISMACTCMCGAIFFLWGRSSEDTVYRRDALAVVGFGWLLVGLFGALPYYVADIFPHYIDAYFEAVSGFTTTGATVLTDIESIPKALLFWRMTSHWLGGMGIIVLFVAIFPQIGVGAKQLFRSEVPGPMTEGLRPKIKETALALWKIYACMTASAALLFMLFGMQPFDAICHAFSTLATGGYSTKNASVGHFDSLGLDVITTLFMLLAGVNFTLYFLVLRGRFNALWRNGELRVYLTITLVVSLCIAINISERHDGFFEAMRYASFQTLAVLTGTGFSTDNFDAYPAFSKMLLVCLMFVGGCAGSTAGGMKIARIMVVFKVAYQETYRVFRPQARMSVRISGSVVNEEVVRSILVFFASFILLFALGAIFMSALGLDLITAATSVAACLGNIGPGLARVGAIENYAHIPSVGKVFLAFCMMLGRLELGTLLVLLVPDFWRR
jgi:trk system potassium uptake protein TrkH